LRMALGRTLMEEAARPAVSRAARYACTVALVKPGPPPSTHHARKRQASARRPVSSAATSRCRPPGS
jgi:hypothetical protein